MHASLFLPWSDARLRATSPLSRALRRLSAAWQRRRARAAALAAGSALDAHALRDLGLDRSELGSCWAEAAGEAERTRRRAAACGAAS